MWFNFTKMWFDVYSIYIGKDKVYCKNQTDINMEKLGIRSRFNASYHHTKILTEVTQYLATTYALSLGTVRDIYLRYYVQLFFDYFFMLGFTDLKEFISWT